MKAQCIHTSEELRTESHTQRASEACWLLPSGLRWGHSQGEGGLAGDWGVGVTPEKVVCIKERRPWRNSQGKRPETGKGSVPFRGRKEAGRGEFHVYSRGSGNLRSDLCFGKNSSCSAEGVPGTGRGAWLGGAGGGRCSMRDTEKVTDGVVD